MKWKCSWLINDTYLLCVLYKDVWKRICINAPEHDGYFTHSESVDTNCFNERLWNWTFSNENEVSKKYKNKNVNIKKETTLKGEQNAKDERRYTRYSNVTHFIK